MADRLRALLDRPLDPAAGRAILALATAIFLGFAVLVVLGGVGQEPRRQAVDVPRPTPTSAAPTPAPSAVPEGRVPPAPRLRRQDPQDRRGSAAARRAAGALRAHRALQHVPFRHGGLAIELAGASGGKAVLAVRAATLAAARRGWRDFLERFHDRGRAYVPRFSARGRGR